MKSNVYLFLFFIISLATNSQNIQGVIYDAESKLKDIKVTNISKKITTYSDDRGNFSIKASVKDTLVFYSLFYEQKKEVITKDPVENKMVIELKKITNDLNEVVVTDDSKNKEFDSEKNTAVLNTQINNDYELHPLLYKHSSGNIGNALFLLSKYMSKLFKKEKLKPEVIEPINHKQLDSLFSKDNFLNDKFLVKELDIPMEYKPLFFEYCEAQNINGTFINEDNKMLLLDALFKYSNTFKTFLSDYEQGKIKE